MELRVADRGVDQAHPVVPPRRRRRGHVGRRSGPRSAHGPRRLLTVPPGSAARSPPTVCNTVPFFATRRLAVSNDTTTERTRDGAGDRLGERLRHLRPAVRVRPVRHLGRTARVLSDGAFGPLGRLVAADPLRRRVRDRPRHREVPVRQRHLRGADGRSRPERRPGPGARARVGRAPDQRRPSAAHLDPPTGPADDESGARGRVRGVHPRAVPSAGRRRRRHRRRRRRLPSTPSRSRSG